VTETTTELVETDAGIESRADYLRTEFLERIAHELRGPAGVTLGVLDELELSLGTDVARHRALLAMARRGALRVLRTAERLTRAAQLESGAVSFCVAPADLREVVRRACADASVIEGRSHVKVTEIAPDLPCNASIDEGWAQAALTELVSHALRLAAREVRVEVTDRAQVIVTHDGASSTEVPARRFERRADRRDAGLALPMVRQVVDALGGQLSFDTADLGSRALLAFKRA